MVSSGVSVVGFALLIALLYTLIFSGKFQLHTFLPTRLAASQMSPTSKISIKRYVTALSDIKTRTNKNHM